MIQTPYPTLDHYIIDCNRTSTKIYSHLESGKLPDKQQAHLPILCLDEEKLQLTIEANGSVLVCDAETDKLVSQIYLDMTEKPCSTVVKPYL